MIWVIANSVEEDGAFPTYRFYKKAFDDREIDIYCANGDDNFSFINRDDIVLLRTRDGEIMQNLRDAQKLIGFKSTIESSKTEFLTHDKEALKGVLYDSAISFPQSVKLKDIIDGKKYFVKPRYGENSICIDGDSICTDKKACQEKMQELFEQDVEPMVEEYIDGEEMTTTIINCTDGIKCWTATIKQEKSKILCGDVKQTHKFIAEPCEKNYCNEIAKKIFSIVGAKFLLRIDFRLQSGTPYVIDVNMLPGLAPDGFMARCVGAYGVGYHELIRSVVNTAL